MLTGGFVYSFCYIRITPSYVPLIRDEFGTLTTTQLYRRSRIAEITRDHSLLQIISEREAWIYRAGGDEDFIDLQPDGDTFDLIAWLIMTKR